ncbi:MAG: formate dehydrogenase subunit alpha [Gammaproteobacteria bacterium]|nr:formate dehydrogenase subunit alpha [Gammaproteobacteria bacterium]MXX95553.1 formate dehydrogenase subunit alpha [Gammaproteobacteria bacterium]MYF52807.1 formate dehydrogenase subunit alpha [Gammaproteobacteria bacterium]MYK43598.1 formate dehydrogenase subunit alpha [Gammaproteobacteria bacterium]
MRLREQDYGTPAPRLNGHQDSPTVSLNIDGINVSVPNNTSIMRAAVEAGIPIPKLCASDNLKSFGSCRLCLVEIEGRRGLIASCTEPVQANMRVKTQTPQVAEIRRGVMELYISDHPLDCLTCPANGDCELEDMAGAVGLREVRYEIEDDHLDATIDQSNPYFQFDPSKCIVCSKCVRACDEVQGTFALTIDGRGWESKVATSADLFMDSECVSCGACVQACPTATLMEKSVVNHGVPDRTVLTTCAYCGVGCSFKAELKGDQVVRMVPYKEGKANHGHSCVKGRFAYGYANHPDRITQPMIRDSVEDPWQVVDWDTAIKETASRFKEIQEKYGRKSIGGISSSRTTIEDIYLVQKLVRTAFGNNNIDTCARVCHSPTGYGLKQTFGTSAGTQHFDSVEEADVIVVIGANPTEGHPVFASHLKQCVRKGAKVIVIDPRKIDMVRSPHIEAELHLALLPGTNVPIINAFAHVVLQEGLADEEFVNERCDLDSYADWRDLIQQDEYSPDNVALISGVPAKDIREAARLYANAKNAAIYYGLGVTEHSQGSTMVMGMANLAMVTGNIGRMGVGVNPLRGQNNVQGAVDVGSFPHELPGYRKITEEETRSEFEEAWSVIIDPEPGYRIPKMFDEACAGRFKGMFIQGEDFMQSDPNTKHVEQALKSMDCVVIQDLFLTETAKLAHIFLPGTTFLEKNGTFVNAERRINRVRPAMKPVTGMEEWQVIQKLACEMGYPMHYNCGSEIMDELAQLTPMFQNVSFDYLDEVNSVQWPCNEDAPLGTEIMHIGEFVRGKGNFVRTEYLPTKEKTNRKFPLLLTTGRKLTQYNVGTQTRRTENNVWLEEDRLEIHPVDAELRGIRTNDLLSVRSRMGEITLRAEVTDRVNPGVVYTTFHHPSTGTNVVTTELSDWATNCPEYKVTAVEVHPANHLSDWYDHFVDSEEKQHSLLPTES